MADALCGPSNALQQFQKHSSVDRTLQQDRLVGRHSPAQGFRSSPGPAAGALDADFAAFESGHAGPPLQPDFLLHHQNASLQLNHAPPPQFSQVQHPQGPDWASDFQRLNIASHAPPVPQQHAASNAAASWHQDFMAQQVPLAAAQNLQQQRQNWAGNMNMGMANFDMRRGAFTGTNGGMGMAMNEPSQIAQGKQRAQGQVPQFDDAAFEQAFAQVMEEEAEAEARNTEPASTHHEANPGLQRLQEQRPAVYSTIEIRNAVNAGQTAEALKRLDGLEQLERDFTLSADPREANFVTDTLHEIAAKATASGFQDVKTRAETLIRVVNERLMSSYPLLSKHTHTVTSSLWEDLEAAGIPRTRTPQQVPQPESQVKEKQELHPPHDGDEMAATAGKLLEHVADNTSEKFQNSQFLELMRKLRDREVRVEGDKVVEVSEGISTSTTAPQPASQRTPQMAPEIARHAYETPSGPQVPETRIPDIDPTILNHADTDFSMPVWSSTNSDDEYGREYQGYDEELPSCRQSTNGSDQTDEITGQFRWYKVNAAYHRWAWASKPAKISAHS